MSFVKTLWGLFFRLFPCPTPVGLRRAGKPTRGSPVLVTCNFHLTVKRLMRILEKAERLSLENEEDVRRRVQIGSSPKTDLIAARAGILQAQIRLERERMGDRSD